MTGGSRNACEVYLFAAWCHANRPTVDQASLQAQRYVHALKDAQLYDEVWNSGKTMAKRKKLPTKKELDDDLQHFLDRRRSRPGNCKICGKPNRQHRAKITDPANGCALAELLYEIAEVQTEHVRAQAAALPASRK